MSDITAMRRKRITGLSDRRYIPRLGKIRLGVKATSAKGVEYPKEVDFFVCPPEVIEKLGPEPKSLEIYFPCEDEEKFFPQELLRYGQGQILCRGNGEEATEIDRSTGEQRCVKCPCPHLTRKEPKPDCSATANLMVIIPAVGMGCYQIDTHSKSNITQLNSAIDQIRGLLHGRISFVPLTLRRVKKKIQTPGGLVEKALLQLEFTGNIKDVAAYRQGDAISRIDFVPPAPVLDGPDLEPTEIVEEEDGFSGVVIPASPQDAPGSTISPKNPEPDPEPAPQGEPQASPAPLQPAGVKPAVTDPLPAGKIRMLESLFRGKGISGKAAIDEKIKGWYGVPLVELPSSAFDEVKARIATLTAMSTADGPF
jgi:hypothetical protein